MNINDALGRISTIIFSNVKGMLHQGTGFYYNKFAPKIGDGPQYRRIDQMWLVTNRHVLLPIYDATELAPSTFTFHLRRITESGSLAWDPITLSTEDVARLARFHPDKSVDVAALNVLDFLTNRLDAGGNYVAPYGLSSDRFPGENYQDIEVASDVVVVGYPRGFYDTTNLFPIVKSGIVASRWGVGFKGNPYFLIDAKLFPGSSGSVVLSKPNDLMVKNGEVLYAKEKQFAFLGVFSGEPTFQEAPVVIGDLKVTQTSGFNLGVVWYADLVEEIINKGIPLSQALAE